MCRTVMIPTTQVPQTVKIGYFQSNWCLILFIAYTA